MLDLARPVAWSPDYRLAKKHLGFTSNSDSSDSGKIMGHGVWLIALIVLFSL